MNMKLTSGLLGIGALLIASLANAATISVNPAVNDVVVGDIFSLTVSGDFTGEATTFGGGVTLSWNSNQVQLTTDTATAEAAVIASLSTNFWDIFNPGSVVVTASSVTVDVFNFGGALPTFDLFSLDLVAVPPPGSGPIGIDASPIGAATGGWEGRPVDYLGATVNVSAVPVPAAVWLFGSGLIGLVGIARRRTPQKN